MINSWLALALTSLALTQAAPHAGNNIAIRAASDGTAASSLTTAAGSTGASATDGAASVQTSAGASTVESSAGSLGSTGASQVESTAASAVSIGAGVQPTSAAVSNGAVNEDGDAPGPVAGSVTATYYGNWSEYLESQRVPGA